MIEILPSQPSETEMNQSSTNFDDTLKAASAEGQTDADEHSAAVKAALDEYVELEIIRESVNAYRQSSINLRYKILFDN